VTLPRSDTQSARTLLRRPHFQPLHTNTDPTNPINLPPYSKTATGQAPTPPQTTPPVPLADVDGPAEIVEERAFDFASHSWDLATGGLKTLTAKREVPVLPERRSLDTLQGAVSVQRSSIFLLIIAVCVLLMVVSGSVVLFVMLQP
jgi:hypothetical protein